MEILAMILLVLIIIAVIILLSSYIFALYQINKIRNKIGSNILNKIKKKKKDE